MLECPCDYLYYDSPMSAETTLRDEILKLSAENAKLTSRVAELESESKIKIKPPITDIGAKYLIGLKFLRWITEKNLDLLGSDSIYGSFIPAMFNALSGASVVPDVINLFVDRADESLIYLHSDIKRCLLAASLGFTSYSDLLKTNGFKITDAIYEERYQRLTIRLIKETELFSVVIDTIETNKEKYLDALANSSISIKGGLTTIYGPSNLHDITIFDFFQDLAYRQTCSGIGRMVVNTTKKKTHLFDIANFAGLELPRILRAGFAVYGYLPKIDINSAFPLESNIEVECRCPKMNISLGSLIRKTDLKEKCSTCDKYFIPVLTKMPRLIFRNLNFVGTTTSTDEKEEKSGKPQDAEKSHPHMSEEVYQHLEKLIVDAKLQTENPEDLLDD
ncbi:MAG: hypothetical protein Harvfovirus34_11 [Harvfovirus sp.]|uniref:Uncharacterized protein n=1 Tax=Harvfovirus sp. TaxID=2487768 RepID=A0A3G5A2J0_9VIRU|nr:MAG: hypothetical protein Harvfovirus34_11 [Harvfovirus sp.]